MWEPLIRNLSKYVPLTSDEVKVVESLFTFKKYRKRQYILQEGDVTRYETFILKGVTRTYQVDDKGQEHIVQFGLEDWWIGDLFSFLTETPTTYNIDCLEETEVVQITKADLETLYEKVPKMERHFRLIIQNAFIASTRRLSSNLSKSAPERYEDFIKKYPQIDQRVANHQIASYLGITPQTLSRIRSQAAERQ
ncbi:Crp/Fnr family transcriptional regulator [Dyadobacter sp. CY326]|uniref:Crp/Fnr family transcriptional regulator n=1 Tax=Dyadobacter sp. CY326 TaxID=2907300 RepID=UPI001F48E602|nr:Crp/Fnr family transcriptional regulator [Dyadobacter sp. CY326]MCE7063857.1 Crp/Fnr family transcriptional regulator [Dyadobacter sp. CY326]